jgi:hypothetical protein
LVGALVDAVDLVDLTEQAFGGEAGATADVEHAVVGSEVEHRNRLGAHRLGPDERVHLVVHLREVLVEQPSTTLVLENSHYTLQNCRECKPAVPIDSATTICGSE